MLLLTLMFATVVCRTLAQFEGTGCRLRVPGVGACRGLRRCGGTRLCAGLERGVPRPPPGTTSARMCREHSLAAWQREKSPVLLLDDSEEDATYYAPKCGLQDTSPLIIGGTQAQLKEFPHMAAVGFGEKNDSIAWVCGGALISEWYVLTAGHCLQDPNGPEGARWVLLGDLTLGGDNPSTSRQLLGVAERIAHPQYRRPVKYHDIALLRLEQAARLSNDVRPACLQTRTFINARKVIATGWGRTSAEQPISEDLMKVDLTLQPTLQCQKAFNITLTPSLRTTLPKGILEESMLCAGEMAGGKDTCQGDSGGPLQVPMDKHHCMYSIVGVTSFGRSCARPNQPAVYTRVSFYIQWIESFVWKLSL
ncbi:serine protease snake-like isoform X2 [Bacillus rossius redtenbacheri]|uniref:serine protease snake-like isoform X2 n=1 Tax=Bacillus rossius redtenbacheri TaxID=93214 RepID=UPI002FDE05FD